jgi:DNA/RNA endonuclease YhcR with UshA esterase domain
VAQKASNHLGKHATVCGKVVSANYASRSREKPTFLNLDKPYPRQVFTAVIWGEDWEKFDEPETTYRGKNVCVTGKIGSYRDVPQIIVNEPSQIEVKKLGTR